MKKLMTRALALAVCGAVALSLTACGGGTAPAESAAESTAESTAPNAAPAIEETDPLAIKASEFDYSEGLDDNGYFTGIKALELVTLPADYKNLTVNESDIAPSEEEIQENIDYMLSQYPTITQDTESAIVDGDNVNIDYVGSVDGVEFTGGNTNGMGADVTAGSAQYVDDFLTQIIGHKPGETFDVLVTFPEGYSDSTDANGNALVLANKEAKFVVTVNYITREEEAIWNDDFVAQYIDPSYGTTTEEFTETLRHDMRESNLSAYALNYLMENTVFPEELPADLMEYNLLTVLSYYSKQALSYGMSLSSMIETVMGCTVQEYADDCQSEVEEITRQSLITQAIAEDNNMTVTDDDLSNTITDASALEYYTQYYGKNYMKMSLLSQKTLEFVVDNAVAK